jgi:hypothetical protein
MKEKILLHEDDFARRGAEIQTGQLPDPACI